MPETRAYKLAVIGHPVAQSKSPLIHTGWLHDLGLSGSYVARDIAPENFATGIAQMIAEGFTGWNVTIPHKEAMFTRCDALSDVAKAIGAVNTVKVNADGTLFGTNTDADGWWESIAPMLMQAPDHAVVLGAGGAARAIVYALTARGIKTTLANRTISRAEALAGQFDADVVDWNGLEHALAHADLLVNTTSLGMENQPELVLDLSALPPHALVSDLIYKPQITPLLAQAQARGLRTVNGLGMLLEQAKLAFTVWTGTQPVITNALRQQLEG